MTPTILDPATIDRIVSQTLPGVTDPTHTNAVVFTVDQDGAEAVAHFKLHEGAGWQLTNDAVARHEWSGGNSIGDRLVLSWP